MIDALLELLVDPHTKAALRADGDVLASPDGRRYPVVDGIPRFVALDDDAQAQTASSFGYKWRRRESYESDAVRANARKWLLTRHGFDGPAAMRDFFASRDRVLDAGCGSGFSSGLWLDEGWADRRALWVGADISDAVDVAHERLGHIAGTAFVQADVMALPFREGSFGGVFSEGVLHHTPSTRAALDALVPLLEPGGKLLFYVYRRKAPIRELTDDYVRERVSSLEPEDAWESLKPLTQLGRALAELEAEVDVPDVPLLGIKAGRYDVQRLVYWHLAKLYWNPELSLEENTHVQFDWYHPRYAHRQTEDEVRKWCAAAGLEIERCHVEEAGITVRATRR